MRICVYGSLSIRLIRMCDPTSLTELAILTSVCMAYDLSLRYLIKLRVILRKCSICSRMSSPESIYSRFTDIITWVSNSDSDPMAMYRYLTYSETELRAAPSAILLVYDTAARCI